jgi:predicted metal-dependent enzyme (double-stranded beta helix superfamily)
LPLSEKATTLVAEAMDDIRAIDAAGVDRNAVESIRDRLLELAAHRSEFSGMAFPAPGLDEDKKSAMYRIAQDDDDRFALYVSSVADKSAAPPHDHTTWAVIVGIEGQERNVRYSCVAKGGAPEPESEFVVEEGTGIAFLPDDVHSIHIDGGALNFHCYGLALEELHSRNYWNKSTEEWKVFNAVSDIREGRR